MRHPSQSEVSLRAVIEEKLMHSPKYKLAPKVAFLTSRKHICLQSVQFDLSLAALPQLEQFLCWQSQSP